MKTFDVVNIIIRIDYHYRQLFLIKSNYRLITAINNGIINNINETIIYLFILFFQVKTYKAVWRLGSKIMLYFESVFNAKFAHVNIDNCCILH